MPDTPSPAAPAPVAAPAQAIRADGKCLWAEDRKWFLNGVSYGPFRPGPDGEGFPAAPRLRADFAQIQALGFNAVRLYGLPTPAVSAAALASGQRLLVTIPWSDHVDFLRSPARRRAVEASLAGAVRHLRGDAAVAAILVGNEIEKSLARWLGPRRLQLFLERLIAIGQREWPDCIFGYANYPSTEYLTPRNADFVAVNVYLEEPDALRTYLRRLQNLAGNKPLVITEFGIDVANGDEARQAAAARWFRRCLHGAGAAGGVWFSFTDEWFRGGQQVTQWRFGLVDEDRTARSAASEIAASAGAAEAPGAAARISVVVCTRNGSTTLAECLASLQRLAPAAHEIILIDDGSTHDIAAIARQFPGVCFFRQEPAGLSAARNLGANLAAGDIIAYTDDDCLADESWLAELALAFSDPAVTAAGGPNVPPPPRNRTEAVTSIAPGAPAQVLLNDEEAEHLPGCNLAVRKGALLQVGGFDAVFTTAGDDVDICWRLRQRGGVLRFSHSAFVWHHRRATVRGYLRQQHGYGKAEALLIKRHPRRFGWLGGARWRGAIYGDWAPLSDPSEGAIYHGPMGSAPFQGIYTQGPACWLEWLGGLPLPLAAAVALASGWLWTALALIALAGTIALCKARRLAAQPRGFSVGENALLWLLCWLQPMVRDWGRVTHMIRLGAWPRWRPELRQVFKSRRPRKASFSLGEISFWSDSGKGRDQWLEEFRGLLQRENLPFRTDDGWRWFDVEVNPDAPISPAVISVSEYHGQDRLLTRVRLLVRVRLWLILGAVAAVGLVLGALLQQPRLGALTLAGAALLLAFCAGLQRVALRRCVSRAAQSAGLTPLRNESD